MKGNIQFCKDNLKYADFADIDDRAKEVIKSRANEETLASIGDRLNLGAERVRQIELMGIKKIKHPKTKKRYQESINV